MDVLKLLILCVLVLMKGVVPGINSQILYNNYQTGYENGALTFEVGNCPLKCRCMALSHLESRMTARGWQSDGIGEGVWKGAEGQDILRGVEVVCSGLSHVPWLLPDGELIYLASNVIVL